MADGFDFIHQASLCNVANCSISERNFSRLICILAMVSS